MILKTIQKLPVEKARGDPFRKLFAASGKKAKEKKKNGAKAVNAIRKCKLQVVGTNKPINHLNSAAPAVKVVVAIQLHDPIHRSQSQSSQPIGGTPFENTTNLDSLIHSLNFPSYHACLLAGRWHGMHIPSQFSSAHQRAKTERWYDI
jgi:hypothetical protein